MYLKTMRPTYSGADILDKVSMLIAYVEELGEEISYRLESLSQTVEDIKKDIYAKEAADNENA